MTDEADVSVGEDSTETIISVQLIRPERGLLGARGLASGREFDPTAAGGPIGQLNIDVVRITDNGIQVVEQHLARFGPDRANEVMLDRSRQIARGGIKPSMQDLNFYTHELNEFARYRNLGWETGQPSSPEAAYELWNNCHTAALEDHGLREVVTVVTNAATYLVYLLYDQSAWQFLDLIELE